MAPVTQFVFEKCLRQTQDLFDCFLNLDQYEELEMKKTSSKECQEGDIFILYDYVT